MVGYMMGILKVVNESHLPKLSGLHGTHVGIPGRGFNQDISVKINSDRPALFHFQMVALNWTLAFGGSA